MNRRDLITALSVTAAGGATSVAVAKPAPYVSPDWPIVYRVEKGAPLTVEELDSNFRELARRIDELRKTRS